MDEKLDLLMLFCHCEFNVNKQDLIEIMYD